MTWTAAKTPRKDNRARRRGQLRPRSAIAGAPRTMPTANAEVSRPAVGMDTRRSAEMPDSRPDSMNSEVPWAKTASPRA